jgi:N-acetylglutamate synthase-like GNAT family acetyltransferase
MGAFRKKSATQAEVKRMRVLPEFQRQGFGQAILNQLEDRAQQMDYTELILDTTTKQLSAQILYEKNGFVEVKREMLPPFELIIYRKTRYNQLRVNKAKIGLCSGLNISFPNAYLLTCSNLLEGVLRDILFHYSKALCGTN